MPTTIRGIPELISNIQKLARDYPREAAAALYQEALKVEKLSRSLTPVETGALRASHETEFPKIEGGDVSIRIRVGGPAAGYAVYVHENLEAFHKVGQAKFLESAINASREDLIRGVAARLSRTVEG